MNIINEIREKQNELIVMINTTFDEIVKKVENSQIGVEEVELEYEKIYPITNTAGFKGKKPIAVKIGEESITAPTWKVVVKIVLEKVIEDEEMKKKLDIIKDKVLGRVRKRLSSTDEGMRSPLKICENLYIETHYDTETLMKLLIEILDNIKYNYNDIKIIIKN